jgi:hypothetical protein
MAALSKAALKIESAGGTGNPATLRKVNDHWAITASDDGDVRMGFEDFDGIGAAARFDSSTSLAA